MNQLLLLLLTFNYLPLKPDLIAAIPKSPNISLTFFCTASYNADAFKTSGFFSFVLGFISIVIYLNFVLNK